MNKEIIELREVVTKLVPLLTGKGLTVTQRGSRAYVKVNRTTLKPESVNIPNITDNAEPDFIRAIQGFIDHEVAHVLITNWDDYLVKGNPSDPKNQRLQTMVNIVEDTMIEREIVKIFPGSRKNIADLRRHFIDKITVPAVKQARGDEKAIFEVILVPVMRALAGHQEFQEWLDKEKLWANPFVKELVDKLSPATKALLPKMTNTKQTRAAAEEVDGILYPPQPPQPPQTPPQSQDKPEKQAGSGDGTGERDHSDESDEDGEESEESSKGAKSKKPKKDEEDEEDKEGEEDAGDGDEEEVDSDEDGDDQSDDGDGEDNDDPDPSEDADEEDGDGSGEGDEEEDEASEDDDEDGDGESGAGGSSEDESEDQDSESGESSGGGNSDDDDGDGDDADQTKGHGDTFAIDDRDHHAANNVGSSEKQNRAGGGVGGADDSGRSMFGDLDDDAFENADISSKVSILLTNKAVAAINASDYSVYTREFDKIEIIPVPQKIDSKWVPELEERTRQMTGRMQKDIERMLASQSHVVRTPGWKSGRLHAPSLHRLRTGDDRIFNRRQEHKSKDTAVMLLIDNSGSMGGVKINTAMTAGYALSSTLEKVNIPNEVIGFTTGNYYGLPSSISDAIWHEQNQTGVHFSRTTPIHMPIFKTFDERIGSEVKRRFAYMQRAQVGMGGNIDGESLEYGAIRVLKRREKRKVIIVLSDGHPVSATNADGHLKLTVKKLTKMGIDTVGIGIMDDAVRDFYDKCVVLRNIEDLPGQVMQELKGILTH